MKSGECAKADTGAESIPDGRPGAAEMSEHPQADVMTSPVCAPSGDAAFQFTCQEWVALLQLRRRYQDGQDLWNTRELAHLRFNRWLWQSGRIEP